MHNVQPQQGCQLTAQLEMLCALGGSFCSCSSSSSVSVREECDAKDFWAAILAEVTEGPRTDFSRWNCRHVQARYLSADLTWCALVVFLAPRQLSVECSIRVSFTPCNAMT